MAVKNFFLKLADMVGFRHSNRYVKNYLNRANMRSGIFMSAVVIILETWLIIRQHNKYIIPQVTEGTNYFKSLFDNTSLFWLLIFIGFSMFAYCLFYVTSKPTKTRMMVVVITAAIGFALCALLPLENRISNFNEAKLMDTVLLIIFYASIAIFQAVLIFATIYRFKGGKNEGIMSVLIVSIFAWVLLVFGVKVSYGDFFSSSKFDNGVLQHKQLICFLTMTIFVACLLIWKPYISFLLLGTVFLGFYLLLKQNASESTRLIPEGDEVNYITFLISLLMVSISIYNQRLTEARNDEELEILATKDKLSNLLSFEYFCNLCAKKIDEENLEAGEWIYLFLDITSFKVYNDQRGFEEGNKFLRKVGEIITTALPDALISRQSDDHYTAFTSVTDIEEKLLYVEEKVKELDLDIRPGVKVGGYILRKKNEDPHTAIEKARYACATLKKQGRHEFLLYDDKMHEKYNLVQYVVAKIDEAIAKDWIVVYYQPVVYSKDHKLCGVEALARWDDPKHGFLSPGVFIPTLEDAQLAYKLDLAMLEMVCKNMRRVLDEGGVIVPTSINFSRADFSSVNVPEEVVKITNKYKIPTKYLHIEITENALLEDSVDLKAAMRQLKKAGFSIWLDDFGSGYSSFNALKDYEFDVLKLDMEFLKGFGENEKSKPLIKAVIDLADQIGMRTLAEGVETLEQAEFLKSIDCEKLQGYLFSKPISYEVLNAMIADGKLIISKNLK